MDYGKQSVTDPHMYNAYFLFFIYSLLRQPWRSVYSMFYNQRYALKIKKKNFRDTWSFEDSYLFIIFE